MKDYTRLRAAGALLTGLVALSACDGGKSPTDGSALTPTAMRVLVDNAAGTAVSLAPRAATLVYGHGILLRAQILDASGQPVAGAKPAWRSTNPGVATATALADSGLAIDNGRAAISSISPGTALIIASFENFADTATITVIARQDSAVTAPPRATEFTLTARVRGVTISAGGDSAGRTVEVLPGSRVTLTLLPLALGDSLPAGVTRISAPTVVGTEIADANGSVTFRKAAVSRYRLTVEPPAGTAWLATQLEQGPPYWATINNEIWLRKP